MLRTRTATKLSSLSPISRVAIGMRRSVSSIRLPAAGRGRGQVELERFTRHTLPTSQFLPSKPRFYTTEAETSKEGKPDVSQEEYPTNVSEESPNVPNEQKPNVPAERDLLEAFEKMSFNPTIWLRLPDNNDRFKIAYLYLLQVIMYLGRPQASEEAAAQYLSAFDSLPAPPNTPIGRARTCTSICTSAIIHVLSSTPPSSPLRTEHPQIFEIVGALEPLRDRFLVERVRPVGNEGNKTKGWEVGLEEVQDWKEFWGRAMPVLMELGIRLDDAGFGIREDEVVGEKGEAPGETKS